MRDAPSAGSYGARFFAELCRLTKSTGGLTYADTARVREVGREELLLILGQHYDGDSLLGLDSSSPEAFARAVVRDGRPKAPEGAARELVGMLSSLLIPDLPHS
jgi:hypothetical protein